MPTSSESGLTPTTLNIIRFAILLGLVVFGGVAWVLTGSGSFAPSFDTDETQLLRYVFYGLTVLVLGGLLLLQQRAGQAETFQKRGALSIAGYALAESVGLFGAVYLLLTGSPYFFLGGVIVMLLAFLLFPVTNVEDA